MKYHEIMKQYETIIKLISTYIDDIIMPLIHWPESELIFYCLLTSCLGYMKCRRREKHCISLHIQEFSKRKTGTLSNGHRFRGTYLYSRILQKKD